MPEGDRMAALHAELVAEAEAVGLDALSDLHHRLRSIPAIEEPTHSRYTNPTNWAEWKQKIDMGRKRAAAKPGTKDNSIFRRNKVTTMQLEVQDTRRPRRIRTLPRIGYPATLVKREPVVLGPSLNLQAEPPPSKVRGSVAMATMTPHSTVFGSSPASQSFPADAPTKRIIGGAFLKSSRLNQSSSTLTSSMDTTATLSSCSLISPTKMSTPMIKFSASRRFATAQESVGEVGPGSYHLKRLFDGANPREERFREIIAELREQEIRNNLW